MDKFSESDDPAPSNSIQDDVKITCNDGDDNGPKKELEGHGDSGGTTDMPVETMVLGSTTKSGQFVELPPEMLPLILTYLTTKNDIQACRKVNSTWRLLISPILRQVEFFDLKFIGSLYPRDDQVYYRIRLLNDCLESSKKLFGSFDSFPCVKFSLSKFELEEENVQKFFDLYGPSIQSLELPWVQVLVEDGQLKSLSRLLTQQAPNIKHFYLKYLDIHPGVPAVLFNNKQTKLPHLQSLGQYTLENELDKIIMREIMKAADNLKAYHLEKGFQTYHLDFFLSKGKVGTVKKILMRIRRDAIQLWEKFAGLQPTLDTFMIGHDPSHDSELLSRAGAVINKILESSKDTLTTCKLNLDQSDPIPGLKFPVLNKVKVLDISHVVTSFPRGRSLSTIFPIVGDVTLDLSGATSVFWDGFMENNFSSVHTLKISHFENVRGLFRVFPNVKNLSIIPFPLDAAGGIFEHMKGLESLELTVDGTLPANQFPTLDSILTGFSPATCIRLADSEETLEDGEVERLRENPSILQLTGLRTLDIYIWSVRSRFLSRVCGIWAFQKMPQLKVTIISYGNEDPAEIVDAEQYLDVIAPFVHCLGFEN